jgi:nitrogen fixation/metabolism regulation signal transduction histidine kinase
MRHHPFYRYGIGFLIVVLVGVLFLLSNATENTALFGRYFSALLAATVIGLVILVIIVAIETFNLIVAYLRKDLGVMLRGKLMLIFALLALLPAGMVYYFSNQFLQKGIDSWVSVEVEEALEKSLDLSKTAINLQRREITRQMDRVAFQLDVNNQDLQNQLTDAFDQTEALQLDMFETNGFLLASVNLDTNYLRPPKFPTSSLGDFASVNSTKFTLEQIAPYGLVFRAVKVIGGSRKALLQGVFPISAEQSELAEDVSNAYERYRELSYLKEPLKKTFSLVLLFVVLFAVLVGTFFSLRASDNITRPIVTLARGTRSVARGDYVKKLEIESSDELGELVSSFNAMTSSLDETQKKLALNQKYIEQQKNFLETILGRLSAGVLTVGANGMLYDVNDAAKSILSFDLKPFIGSKLAALSVNDDEEEPVPVQENQEVLPGMPEPISKPEHIKTFLRKIHQHSADSVNWSHEIQLSIGLNRLILMCRGTRVSIPYKNRNEQGSVIVFDDITGLVSAQRNAAWGEVAQRLAHEVKNPLTPIQLAAERMQKKLAAELTDENAELLSKSVDVITRQVSSLKDIVGEFSEFAKTSSSKTEIASLPELAKEVHYLFQAANPSIEFVLEIAEDMPSIKIDIRRIRQVLNNLYKNAVEAIMRSERKKIIAEIKLVKYSGDEWLQLSLEDSGSGFSLDTGTDYFEPYVTQKVKGTGLGLAVVKKIVEEHHGFVDISSSKVVGGAKIVMLLPKMASSNDVLK